MTLDISLLRDLLMEIGQKQYNTITDETALVASGDKVYPLFGRIEDVIGVWKVGDIDKTTNLYTGGSVTDGQIINLGTPTNAGEYVLISYVQADGLNDSAAQEIIDQARYQVLNEIGSDDIDIDNPSETKEYLARSYWILIALFNAYLIMNNVNFIQSDANLSLFNYQYNSKLWGEGMSTGELFRQLQMKLKEVKTSLFIAIDADSVYTSEGEPGSYWRDDGMLKEWLATTYQNTAGGSGGDNFSGVVGV